MSEHAVITPRERQEASEVTVQGQGHVFEIQLGHLCNNRCVFCSSGMLTQEGVARPVALEPILAAIDEARAAGARRVIFLGGEPTLHKGFLTALAHTVSLGFPEIVIFTNGVLLPQPGFIDKVLALGDFEWRISIQGADEASHVAVTGRPQSFKRIIAGLEELQRRGQRVTANMCVNEHSYRSLPSYPALAQAHRLTQLHIDIIRPSSAGTRSLDYFREIMPRYSDMTPYLEQMLQGFEDAAAAPPADAPPLEAEVSVGNLPFCTLRAWPLAVRHGGEGTVTVASDEQGLEPEVDKYAWHASMREHLPACEGCALRSECTGVFSTYLEIYGGDEFQAITAEELLALPPARRPFFALARPQLTPLLDEAARAPAGFALERRHEDPEGRQLSLTYRHRQGRLTLRFESPELSGAGLWARDGAALIARAPAWSLAAVVDPGLEDAQSGALIAWAAGLLPEAEALTGAAPLERLALARRLAPARLQARRALARLCAEPPAEGWRWGQEEADGAAQIAWALGPAGARVGLGLVAGEGPQGPRARLELRLDPATPEPIAGPVVAALTRRLRG